MATLTPISVVAPPVVVPPTVVSPPASTTTYVTHAELKMALQLLTHNLLHYIALRLQGLGDDVLPHLTALKKQLRTYIDNEVRLVLSVLSVSTRPLPCRAVPSYSYVRSCGLECSGDCQVQLILSSTMHGSLRNLKGKLLNDLTSQIGSYVSSASPGASHIHLGIHHGLGSPASPVSSVHIRELPHSLPAYALRMARHN